MIVLYNKGLLYAKVMMNLRIKMSHNGRVFDNKKQEGVLLLPEEVMTILQRNGDIKIWNGENYIKLNLGQFYEIMQHKKYNVVDYVEPKKEEVKPEPKQEVKVQPKQEKVEPPKKEVKQEEIKEEPKQEEVKVEQPKQEHDNKKQRHNKQQGGDK